MCCWALPILWNRASDPIIAGDAGGGGRAVVLALGDGDVEK